MTDLRNNNKYSFDIHSIEWTRVNMNIEGILIGELNGEYSFYLKSTLSQTLIPIKKVNRSGQVLTISFNITTVSNNDRVPDGDWKLILKDSAGTEIEASVANNLLIDGSKNFTRNYSKNFKTGPGRVYKMYTRVIDSDKFILTVCFRQPKRKRKFKTIKIKRISHIFRNLLFRSIFYVTRIFVKKNGKRILFTSASRSSLGGNLKVVHDRLIERNLDEELTILTSFKHNIWARSSWKDKFKLPYYLGIADKILLEDYQPMVNSLKYDEKTDIIQLWHANGAFKTFGYSRLGKPASPRLDGSNHRIYTKAITSSKHVIPYYAEAFAISEDNVVATGIPKSDIFFDSVYKEDMERKMKDIYPQISDANNVILFGPTFRGGGPKTAFYPMEVLDFKAMAKFARNTNSIFLFKMHFLVRNKLEIPSEYSDVLIDVTDYREINDLLFVTDVLITDYSSTVYEASLLDIPMIFYAFDLEEYISARDFYDEFESFVPGKIVKDFDSLMNALKQREFEYEKVDEFKKLHFEFLDNHASDRVIDWLILDENAIPEMEVKKP